MTNDPLAKYKQQAAAQAVQFIQPGMVIGLAAKLSAQAWIIGHGLFLGLADDVIVASPGGIQHMQRASP